METAFSSKLIEVLDEQMAFLFTGRVNVLKKENGQLLGIVILKEGEIIFAKYGRILGIKGLGCLLIEDITRHNLKFVVEPEVVEEVAVNIHEKLGNLPIRFKVLIKNTLDSLKLRPPDNLRLAINKDFILEGEEILPEEFDILCVISDFNKVFDIYKESPLFDYQITNVLVSLRRKKAVKVLSEKED